MPAPTFRHCGGDILDDAGQVITLDEASTLAGIYAEAAERSTNATVRAGFERAAQSIAQAIVERSRWHRCAVIRPDWSVTAKVRRNLSRTVAEMSGDAA